MFASVSVDGSTLFVAGQSSHVDLDISDDDTIDEEDDEVTPLSVGTKRASNTSTTASSPSKRPKSPAVRSMDGHMREHNDISRLRLERMTSMWQQRNQAIEDQAKAQERKVAHVLDLARQCGATEETPVEWMAMLKIV
jgi:hypothetical protein